MKDTLSLVLVLLIATTSLNRGEKIKEINKRHVLRTIRPGRSSGMTGFARIDRASGLMPFPRVGRSDTTDYDVVFDFNPEDISEVKRQGLIPYPRVGRSRDVSSSSSSSSLYGNEAVKAGKVKRTGDAVPNGSMWFGPRLGRLHRRGDEQQQSDDQQWAVFPIREYSGAGQQSDNFAPRLSRESEPEDAIQSGYNNGAIY